MSKQIVGIDIGEKSLKLALWTGDRIKAVAAVDLPDNLVAEGRVLSMDVMADLIKQTARENGMPGGNAAMVLPAGRVFVRTLTAPAADERQMQYNMGYIFKDYLSKNQSEYTFDYSIYELRENEEGVAEQRFMACAVETALIEEYRGLLKKAGFRLKCAVPPEVALSNVLRRGRPAEGKGEDICLVDLGHRATVLHMFHDGEPAAKNSLDRGSALLDELIANQEKVDIHMARSYKETNYNRVLNSSACMETYRALGVDIMKAINFFNYNHPGEGIADVYLCGGGAGSDVLRKELQDILGRPVLDAGRLLKSDSAVKVSGLYLAACGCAMNEV